MLRHEWEFEFSAKNLSKAASKKLEYHKERLKFWRAAKEKVMEEVRKEGIDVLESEAGQQYHSNKSISPQIMVRNDLQQRLTECHSKVGEHDRKINEYTGWVAVFEGNIESRMKLHSDDYLFFFGE